jgi:hypothetical protein
MAASGGGERDADQRVRERSGQVPGDETGERAAGNADWGRGRIGVRIDFFGSIGTFEHLERIEVDE